MNLPVAADGRYCPACGARGTVLLTCDEPPAVGDQLRVCPAEPRHTPWWRAVRSGVRVPLTDPGLPPVPPPAVQGGTLRGRYPRKPGGAA